MLVQGNFTCNKRLQLNKLVALIMYTKRNFGVDL